MGNAGITLHQQAVSSRGRPLQRAQAVGAGRWRFSTDFAGWRGGTPSRCPPTDCRPRGRVGEEREEGQALRTSPGAGQSQPGRSGKSSSPRGGFLSHLRASQVAGGSPPALSPSDRGGAVPTEYGKISQVEASCACCRRRWPTRRTSSSSLPRCCRYAACWETVRGET